MKHYKDLFGKNITKPDMVQAVLHTVRTGNPYPANIARRMSIGFFKAKRLVQVIADAGVATPIDSGKRRVLLKEDAAINAALRQLKKGSK